MGMCRYAPGCATHLVHPDELACMHWVAGGLQAGCWLAARPPQPTLATAYPSLYPSCSARLWVPAQRLEAARKCFGTDEDLLLVEVPSASPCCASAGGISSDGGAAAGAVAEGSRLVPPEAANVEQQQQPEDWGAAGPSPRIVYG